MTEEERDEEIRRLRTTLAATVQMLVTVASKVENPDPSFFHALDHSGLRIIDHEVREEWEREKARLRR